METVSIVVPVYKVENYLYRCINSILNQTYPQLEVILVNDGSPDECGAICDEYKRKDLRIRVLHKENGGLSDARNAGLELVTGTYTMFVDSDDWIAETTVEKMVDAMNHYDADVVQGSFYYAYSDKLFIDKRFIKTTSSPLILNRQEAMYELIKNEVIKNFAWGKLYKTEIVKKYPFQKGVYFEDVYWQYLIIDQVRTYVALMEPFYYYYQRNDSIVGTFTEKHIDFIRGLIKRHEFIEKNYAPYRNTSFKTMLPTFLSYYDAACKHRNRLVQREIETFINKNYVAFKQAITKEKQLNRRLNLFRLHPSCYLLYRAIVTLFERANIVENESVLKQVNT